MNKFWTRTVSGAVYVLLMVGAIYAGRLTGNTTVGTYVFGAVFFLIGLMIISTSIAPARLSTSLSWKASQGILIYSPMSV